MIYLQKRLAFTLSEVLITLGIIGIVAALTIPTLIANSQKMQYVTGLEKNYSAFNQALAKMALDAGCPGDLSCFFDSSDTKTMGDKIASYFKVAKNCDNTQTGCWADVTSDYYDGQSAGSGHDNVFSLTYKFITADGTAISIFAPSLGCKIISAPMEKICSAQVFIDVNGKKGPNYFGRDIFGFIIDNDNGPSLYPWGGPKYSYWKDTKICDYPASAGAFSKNGTYCAARIMEEGWQMNY